MRLHRSARRDRLASNSLLGRCVAQAAAADILRRAEPHALPACAAPTWGREPRVRPDGRSWSRTTGRAAPLLWIVGIAHHQAPATASHRVTSRRKSRFYRNFRQLDLVNRNLVLCRTIIPRAPRRIAGYTTRATTPNPTTGGRRRTPCSRRPTTKVQRCAQASERLRLQRVGRDRQPLRRASPVPGQAEQGHAWVHEPGRERERAPLARHAHRALALGIALDTGDRARPLRNACRCNRDQARGDERAGELRGPRQRQQPPISAAQCKPPSAITSARERRNSTTMRPQARDDLRQYRVPGNAAPPRKASSCGSG